MASQFWCQMAPNPAYDHSVHALGDWTLWRDGQWLVPHPVEYDEDEWVSLNTALYQGMPSMREHRDVIDRFDGPDYHSLTGRTWGHLYPNQTGPDYCDARRHVIYLPGAVDVVVIVDVVQQTPISRSDLLPKHQGYFDSGWLTGFLTASGPVALNGHQEASWPAGSQTVTARWLTPGDMRLRVLDGQRIQWSPQANRAYERVICVVAAGSPEAVSRMTARVFDTALRVQRPGMADVMIAHVG